MNLSGLAADRKFGKGTSVSALRRKVMKALCHCPQPRCKCGRPISANKLSCLACKSLATAEAA